MATKKYIIVDFANDENGISPKIFNEITPKKAANKAFSYLLQFIDIDKDDDDFLLGKFLVFVIKNIETDKEYKFIGNRVTLANPIKIKNNTVKYKNIVGKFNPELDLI
jgi:hypothetical protein